MAQATKYEVRSTKYKVTPGTNPCTSTPWARAITWSVVRVRRVALPHPYACLGVLLMEKIGRYEIVGELGKGAMGVVYKAQDPTVGRMVAIKTLRIDIHGAESEEMLERFRNEARTAGVLNHPNIITIYDAGEQDGLFYIAMEFVEGQTLQHLLKDVRHLHVDKAIDIVKQVCAGLDYAHTRGIIHRDIKPANIMIGSDETVKIMDFGIAKSGSTGVTSTGHVVGTPNYMAPEQVRGRPLDGRSDLFSLGVILYEMLTGERPFAGDTITTIIYKVVNEMPVNPREREPSLHAGICAVTMKALAKNPDERFGTCAEFSRAAQGYAVFTQELKVDPAAVERFKSARLAGPPAPAQSAAAAPAMAKSAPQPATTKLPAAPTPLSPLSNAKPVAAPGNGVSRSLQVETPAPEKQADKTVSLPRASEEIRRLPNWNFSLNRRQIIAIGAGALIAVVSIIDFSAYVRLHRRVPLVLPAQTKPTTTAGDTKLLDIPTENFKPKKKPESDGDASIRPTINTSSSAQGTLELNSDPVGAHIYVDGRDSGVVTPARIVVNAGQHRIALRKDGYRPEITYTEVPPGKVASYAPMLAPRAAVEPAASRTPADTSNSVGPFHKIGRFFGRADPDDGVLEVRTRPRGAEIWLGDAQAPIRTPAKVGVTPGNYKMVLKLPGYKPVTRSVQIERGKLFGVEEILQPE